MRISGPKLNGAARSASCGADKSELQPANKRHAPVQNAFLRLAFIRVPKFNFILERQCDLPSFPISILGLAGARRISGSYDHRSNIKGTVNGRGGLKKSIARTGNRRRKCPNKGI